MANINLDTERINPKESMDLVNPLDEVVGTALRRDIYKSGVNNYRVVNIFLFKANKIWLPTRSGDKSIFPNCYDFSCAEHVNSGETYKEAAIRGLEEELNLTVTVEDLKEIAYLKPSQVSSFMKVFELQTLKEPEYNEKDFIKADFYALDEIKRMVQEKPTGFKSDIPKVLKILYEL